MGVVAVARLPCGEPSAQVKGAALTYARRYALFTLVGIAGEDDLDAPEIAIQPEQPRPNSPPSNDGNGRAFAASDVTAPTNPPSSAIGCCGSCRPTRRTTP